MKFKSLSLVEAACKMRGKRGADGGELYLILSTPAAGARGRGGGGVHSSERCSLEGRGDARRPE